MRSEQQANDQEQARRAASLEERRAREEEDNGIVSHVCNQVGLLLEQLQLAREELQACCSQMRRAAALNEGSTSTMPLTRGSDGQMWTPFQMLRTISTTSELNAERVKHEEEMRHLQHLLEQTQSQCLQLEAHIQDQHDIMSREVRSYAGRASMKVRSRLLDLTALGKDKNPLALTLHAGRDGWDQCTFSTRGREQNVEGSSAFRFGSSRTHDASTCSPRVHTGGVGGRGHGCSTRQHTAQLRRKFDMLGVEEPAASSRPHPPILPHAGALASDRAKDRCESEKAYSPRAGAFVEERLVSSGAGMDFGVVARTKELDDPRVLQLQYGLSAAHDACTPSTPHSSSREPYTPFAPLTPFKHLTPFFESRTASRSDAAAHMHSGLPDRRALTVVKPSPRKGPSLSHGGPGDGSLKSSPAGRLGFDSSFTKLPVIPRDKP